MSEESKKNKKNKPFVFNDENVVNTYGFKIKTSGINLTRFKNNPVMLDSHQMENSSVLGNWTAIKKENGLLTAVPNFDEEDEKAAEISGKVKRGFIKACSMGVRLERKNLKIVNGELVLTKCELTECSIVAVPSNAKAIRLYSSEDTSNALSTEEVKELCMSVNKSTPNTIIKDTNMKIKLTTAAAAALELQAGQAQIESEELSQLIVNLHAQKKAAELQLQEIKNEKEAAKLAAINAKVDEAVKAGKISAQKKEEFVNLGIANEEILNTTLAAIPNKRSLRSVTGSASQNNGEESEVKTTDDFQKLSLDQQLQFKAQQPEQYKALFTKK